MGSILAPWQNGPVPHQYKSSRLRLVRTPLLWILTIAGFASLGLAWATSSPVGASPDEDAHIVYAWAVVTGQTLPGRAIEVPNPGGAPLTVVHVPDDIRDRPEETCYAFQTAVPACDAAANELLQGDTATTYMTRYPPLYYAIVGSVMRAMLALGASGSMALLGARLASSLLSVAVIAVGAVAAARRFGTAPTILALLAVSTPQFLFLSASVNPNGFEIASAFAVAAFVICVFSDLRRQGKVGPRVEAGLVLASLCLGMARPASLAWLGAIVLLLALPVRRRMAFRRLTLSAQIGLVASFLVSAAFFVHINLLRDGGVTDSDMTLWKSYSPVIRLAMVVLKFGDLLANGYGLLGWADTPLPNLFFAIWLITVSATVGFQMHRRTGQPPALRPRWAILAFSVCSVAVIGQSYMAAFGWQGRYFAPCIAAFVALLIPSMQADSPVSRGSLRGTAIAIFTVATLNTAALVWNLGRYLYGLSTLYVRFIAMPVPTPTGTWTPLIGRFMPAFVGAVGTLFLVVVGLCLLKLEANHALSGEDSSQAGSEATSTGETETGHLPHEGRTQADPLRALPDAEHLHRSPPTTA